MASKLGKGLGAIFGEDVDVVSLIDDIQHNATSENTNEIELDKICINPYQPRKVFDDKAIEELSESIKNFGVFTPILVRESLNGMYELIAGERRFRAAKMAGLTTIPAIIKNFDDGEMMEIAILENIQRENLSAIEEANGYAKLMDNLQYTQEKLAQRVGKSREYITNIMRLLKLDASVQTMVENGQLSSSSARALLALKDSEQQVELAKEIIAKGLSTRAVEARVKELNQGQLRPLKKTVKKDPYLSDVENRLQHKYDTKVVISKNTITLSYDSSEKLNQIIEALGGLEQSNV